MEYQADIIFTPEIVRKAYRYECWKAGSFEPTRPKEIILTIIVVIFYIFLWMGDDKGWLSYLLLGIVTLYFIAYLALFPIYFVGLKSAMEEFKGRDKLIARMQFTEDLAIDEEEQGRIEVKWSAFERLIKFPDMWLLRGKGGTGLNLPIDQLQPECLIFIEQKLQAVGATVTKGR